MLVLIIGGKPVAGPPMYFTGINACNYYASKVVKRYGNYMYLQNVPEEHKATAYCKPVYIDRNTATLYDY